MLKPNIENSKHQLSPTQKSPSNTPLFLHLLLTLSTNSFDTLFSTQDKAEIEIFSINIHLDYLRISTTISTKKSFDSLLAYLDLPIPYFENKNSWHPDENMPKNKKYQNSLKSDKGIILGYTKRLKDKSKKPKCVYDIMVDFYGSYFAELSLVEQINLIYYLNSNFKPKCHRLDVAIDDYSRKLFSILRMLLAIDDGNYFGFQETNRENLYCTSEGCIGTLYLGSRRSEHYVRLYTFHKHFVRWESELKQNKSQKLFDKLSAISYANVSSDIPSQNILKALLDAALGKIDCNDKSSSNSPKNATRKITSRLPFWQKSLDKIFSAVGNKVNGNCVKQARANNQI